MLIFSFKKRGFTLLELLAVIVIIGILATIGVSQYYPAKERALDKEAMVNLQLIQSAEKIYQMENYNTNLSCPAFTNCTSTSDCNDNLKLSLAAENWEYQVCNAACGNFTAEAKRSGQERYWYIQKADDEAKGPNDQTGCQCNWP